LSGRLNLHASLPLAFSLKVLSSEIDLAENGVSIKGQGEKILIAEPITFYQRHLVRWLAIRKRIANSGHKFIVPLGYLQSVLSKGDPKQLWIQLLKQQFSW
jgi:hypothetical protein